MNQPCFLCEKEIENYKCDKNKITVCSLCTMQLCTELPRVRGESLEIMKSAIEFSKTFDTPTT